jgi:hypothetical protein
VVSEYVTEDSLEGIALTLIESVQATQHLASVIIPLEGELLGGCLGDLLRRFREGLFGALLGGFLGRLWRLRRFGGFDSSHLEQTITMIWRSGEMKIREREKREEKRENVEVSRGSRVRDGGYGKRWRKKDSVGETEVRGPWKLTSSRGLPQGVYRVFALALTSRAREWT